MPPERPRVLVADDQTDVVLALRLLLDGAGLHIDAAASVQEIRARVRAAEYDLLLMDLNYARDTTSGAEGLALLTDLHAHDPLLPVLVMTGWGSIETAVEAMRRGACGVVHKPWDNDALVAAILREVEHGRALRSNYRRAAREQEEAQTIQRALLPGEMPDVPGCELAACWRPASTFGGDLYDATPLDDARVALSIGDVCGKGLPAALLMASVQASVRAFAALDESPAAVVTRLNRDLSRHAGIRRFVTFFFARYDADARRLTYCNAGHPAPVLVRADGSVSRLDAGGTVAGAFANSQYEQENVNVGRGDALVMFTDGIVEAAAPDGRRFDEEALLAIVGSGRAGTQPHRLADSILDAAAAFAQGDLQDDAAVFVASFR